MSLERKMRRKVEREGAKIMRERLRFWKWLADHHSRPYFAKYGLDADGADLLVRIQLHALESGLPLAEPELREDVAREALDNGRDYDVEMRALIENGSISFDAETKLIDLMPMGPVYEDEFEFPDYGESLFD